LAFGDIARGNIAHLEASGSDQFTKSIVAQRLCQLAVEGCDQWLTTGILCASEGCSGQLLSNLAEADRLPASNQNKQLVRDLALTIGAAGNTSELEGTLKTLGQVGHHGLWFQVAGLTGLSSGMGRQQGSHARLSFKQLMEHPPSDLAIAVEPLKNLTTRAVELVQSDSSSQEDRVAAIELLGNLSLSQLSKLLPQLLTVGQTHAVQLAAIQFVRRADTSFAASILAAWPELGPSVRAQALTLLLQRKETAALALQSMLSGQLLPSAASIDQQVMLMTHPDEGIRLMAKQVFNSTIATDRQAVARRYASALAGGDPVAGKKIFQQNCQACHRFGGQGQNVGPDISDTRNRSPEALISDILDPNQRLDPQFTAYRVLTLDGGVVQGLVISDSPDSIVMRIAEGKEQTIERRDIEQIVASGKSLMPEGLENQVTPQQMADLLSYLKGN
jgi:putative heme-binding domain-containing protein